MAPGDIAPRRDTDRELFVVVVSNAVHLAAATGRLIVCPFIPGAIPGGSMAMVVPVSRPEGVILPELVQWLPAVALDQPIGNVGADSLRETSSLVSALIS